MPYSWIRIALRGLVLASVSRAAERPPCPEIASTRSIQLAGFPAFDPLIADAPFSSAIDRSSTGLQIVMTRGGIDDQVLSDIRGAGVRVLGYLPVDACIVRVGDSAAKERLSRLTCVRWVGPYRALYRLPPSMRNELESSSADGRARVGVRRYSILLFEPGPLAQERISDRIRDLGGSIDLTQPAGRRMEATLSLEALISIAASDDVQFIDAWSGPESDMDLVRSATGADLLQSVAGLTGQGVRGEVMDGAMRQSHLDFVGRPPMIHRPGEGDPAHGTSAYGILFGSGASDPLARGMLPEAQGIFSGNTGTLDRHQHTAELLQEPYRAVFQSNSWGSARTRTYTTVSADLDDIAFSLDFAILQSQSNSGNQDSRPEAWAKNVISVGGIRHHDTLSTADDAWDYAGSTGPSIDGRIKPDVSHFADSIWTADSAGDNAHSDFGGTSAATPIVGGCLGLIAQMWSEGLLGNTVSGGDVFDERPHESTLRALLINAARPYAFTSVSDDMGRFRQGWGVPDLAWLFAMRDRLLVVDHGAPLARGRAASRVVSVVSGQAELRVTMVYPDPAGNPAAAITTVNDLSLRVTAPNGDIYWGNHGLLDGTWSVAGGVHDSINTVENVFLRDPEPGQWLIEVIANAINQDAWPATPRLDATYSLVASGVMASPAPPMIVRFPDGLPQWVPANRATSFAVEIEGPSHLTEAEVLLDSGVRLPLRGSPNEIATPNRHRLIATLPGVPCSEAEMRFQIRVVSGEGETRSPVDAPETWHRIPVAAEQVVSDVSSPTGWTVANIELSDGAWAWGSPDLGGTRGDPPTDADGDGLCWLTGPGAVNRDVDGGPTILTSPSIDVRGVRSGVLDAWIWLNCSDAGLPDEEDRIKIECSTDGGTTWSLIADVRPTFHWRHLRVPFDRQGSDSARFRFLVADAGNNSPTEAAIDGPHVIDTDCSRCPADLSGAVEPDDPLFGVPDGRADQIDLFYFLDRFAVASAAADLTGSSDAGDSGFGWPDGAVDATDLFYFLDLFSQGCE